MCCYYISCWRDLAKPLKLLSVVLMLRRLQGEGEIFVCSALMCGLIRCEVSAFVLMHLHRACVCVCMCMCVRVQMYIEADGVVVYYIVSCTCTVHVLYCVHAVCMRVNGFIWLICSMVYL